VIATVTAPVEVSGAVFLLPVQLNLLGVPIPSVTPTNLLYNVIAGPGALLQYRRVGHLRGPLTRLLLAGTIPGVIIGAIIRVFLLPGPQGFRVMAGLVLLAFGLWLIERTISPATRRPMTAAPWERWPSSLGSSAVSWAATSRPASNRSCQSEPSEYFWDA